VFEKDEITRINKAESWREEVCREKGDLQGVPFKFSVCFVLNFITKTKERTNRKEVT
jgi:hypothetical protein